MIIYLMLSLTISKNEQRTVQQFNIDKSLFGLFMRKNYLSLFFCSGVVVIRLYIEEKGKKRMKTKIAATM